jgi:hypothetical protein
VSQKHRIKYATKGGIGLAILKAFQEFLLSVWVLGLLLAVVGSKLRLVVLLLIHSVGYDTHKQSHNK